MKRPTHCAMAALTAAVAALLISSGCNHSGADRGSGDEGDDSDALVFASVPSQESANLQQSLSTDPRYADGGDRPGNSLHERDRL